jgi:hypothetical protein
MPHEQRERYLARRWGTAALLVCSWLGADSAGADLVPPPPRDCPAGSIGTRWGRIAYCAPAECTGGSGSSCDQGATCKDLKLCMGPPPGSVTVLGRCGKDRTCTSGTCKSTWTCIPKREGTGQERHGPRCGIDRHCTATEVCEERERCVGPRSGWEMAGVLGSCADEKCTSGTCKSIRVCVPNKSAINPKSRSASEPQDRRATGKPKAQAGGDLSAARGCGCRIATAGERPFLGLLVVCVVAMCSWRGWRRRTASCGSRARSWRRS